jgi:dinuclear metal center YbgI/SA1388 family protein
MITVGDIYDYIDEFAPFSQQQSYDNSGLCAGSRDMPVKKVLTALDITCEVADEAKAEGCELVISHHPVIFRPLRTLSPRNPAVMLVSNGIAAICAHTSYDSAAGGMNDILCEKLGLEISDTLAYEEGKPIGYVCKLNFESSAAHLAAHCKKRLGCKTVRYSETAKSISRVGVCSGSGGDLLFEAAAKGCQALITGDVKHNEFIDAKNIGMCLIDAGHYYTENIFHRALAEKLAERFPELVFVQAKSGTDPVTVI